MNSTASTHPRLAELRRNAAREPILSPEEARELTVLARRGDAKATDRLVRAHLRLVVSLVAQYAKSNQSVDDLYGEGCIGLLEAIRRFDESRNTRLAAYAEWCIRTRIRDYALADQRVATLPSSRAARKLLRLGGRVRAKLEAQCGEAGDEQLAQELSLSAHELEKARDALSLRGVDVEPKSLVDEAPLAEEEMGAAEVRLRHQRYLPEALNELSEREAEILTARLSPSHGRTLNDLGAALGLSAERVRQLQRGAEVKLLGALDRLVDRAA